MARRNFDVEIPDGQHLGWSQGTDGAWRAHLFDDETGTLVGHAELFEPEDDYTIPMPSPDEHGPGWTVDRDTELEDALAGLVMLGILTAAAVERASPHVKRWWNDTAAPSLESMLNSLRSTWARIARRAPTDGTVELDRPAVLWDATVPTADSAPTRLKQLGPPTMSTDEARQRFAAYLVASNFAAEQEKLLRRARIADEPGVVEQLDVLAALSPQQVEEALAELLAHRPELLEREALQSLRPTLDELTAGAAEPVAGSDRPRLLRRRHETDTTDQDDTTQL